MHRVAGSLEPPESVRGTKLWRWCADRQPESPCVGCVSDKIGLIFLIENCFLLFVAQCVLTDTIGHIQIF